MVQAEKRKTLSKSKNLNSLDCRQPKWPNLKAQPLMFKKSDRCILAQNWPKKNNKISEFAVDYFNRLSSIFNNLDLKNL